MFSHKLWKMVKNMKTYVCRLLFFQIILKTFIPVTDRIIILVFQNKRVERRMFIFFFPFTKVSAKNTYYCGQKLGETYMAHMVGN